MPNWWEDAPLVEQPAPAATANWWDAAPLVEAGASSSGRNIPEFIPPGVEGYNPETGLVERKGLADKAAAVGAGVLDLPIVGPALTSATSALAAGASAPFSNDTFGERYDYNQSLIKDVKHDNPGYALAGQVGGTIAATAPLAATATGARALGIMGENIGRRMLASGLTNAAVSGGDTVVRGGGGADIINNTLIGGGIGAAIPGVGAGISAGVGALGGYAAPLVNAIRNPTREAARRLGSAVARDADANPNMVINAADEAVAREANIPLTNVDRGGETTRALARSVANQSPEARAVIENTASDRFATQGSRATDFVRKLAGGNVDDVGYQQIIKESARRANKPAYDRANTAPQAQGMWDDEFAQLLQAPAMQEAVSSATERGANRAAVEGFKAVESPFVKTEAGYALREAADGSRALPNLPFWDQTKRNLDSMIGRAERGGDNTYAADLKALRANLVNKLDATVPEYQAARRGAASFFAAEDALEAGRKFVGTPRAIPEARKAFETFTPGEQKAFQTGFASELIDKIKAVGDRTNVINGTFKNQAAREQIELVFGPQKAKELEAYVRVEDLADRLRGAMGNSTTARQLVELGLGAGGGYTLSGDWKGAVAGAAVAKGARFATNQAEAKVMQRLGQLLISDDPQAVSSAVTLAARVPSYMTAMEKLGTALAVPVRGAAMTVGQ